MPASTFQRFMHVLCIDEMTQPQQGPCCDVARVRCWLVMLGVLQPLSEISFENEGYPARGRRLPRVRKHQPCGGSASPRWRSSRRAFVCQALRTRCKAQGHCGSVCGSRTGGVVLGGAAFAIGGSGGGQRHASDSPEACRPQPASCQNCPGRVQTLTGGSPDNAQDGHGANRVKEPPHCSSLLPLTHCGSANARSSSPKYPIYVVCRRQRQAETPSPVPDLFAQVHQGSGGAQPGHAGSRHLCKPGFQRTRCARLHRQPGR